MQRLLRFLCLVPLTVLTAQAADNTSPTAVPTFECVGLYWKAPGGSTENTCQVRYRAKGQTAWKQALPLWFDARNSEYRGSIVGLQPGAAYEVRLALDVNHLERLVPVHTWPDRFPVARTNALPASSRETLVISKSGSPKGYLLYAPTAADTATIDVSGQADQCVVIRAAYVIVRGLTLKNARIHGIRLEEGAHDVVIEDCDISGWGRVMEDGWGRDYDSAIYSHTAGLARVVVQHNRIHHPRSNSNNWRQERARPGKRKSSHPEGPQAVCFWDSDGNHVIRYNTVFSDPQHEYNDIFGAGANFSTRGFPNRDSDIYGNLLSDCWDDAIESEGANQNVRIWGNYMKDSLVGVACASTSVGPLYVWRNVYGASRVSPGGSGGAFLKTGDQLGGGKIFAFHNTVYQPGDESPDAKTGGAAVGLGWGDPISNVTSRNNILEVTRQSIRDRAHDPDADYDYDLLGAPVEAAAGQETHGVRGKPHFESNFGLHNGRGEFHLTPQSSGVDAGVVLPNFNDGFTGKAPDLGAAETGSPPLRFGR